MASFVARASRLRILKAAIQDVWAESGFAFNFAGKMAGETPAPQGRLAMMSCCWRN
jgi:putative NADPH-quinone reductase